jgi:hypothetical protein
MLFCQLAYQYIVGSFVVQLKNWFMQQHMRKGNKNFKSDTVRIATVDELTSLAIWLIVIVISIETLSLKLGKFTIKDIFLKSR